MDDGTKRNEKYISIRTKSLFYSIFIKKISRSKSGNRFRERRQAKKLCRDYILQ